MPKIGSPSDISAMFTVNSPFLLMNSLVPSNGSISQKRFHFCLVLNLMSLPSSDKIGIEGS